MGWVFLYILWFVFLIPYCGQDGYHAQVSQSPHRYMQKQKYNYANLKHLNLIPAYMLYVVLNFAITIGLKQKLSLVFITHCLGTLKLWMGEVQKTPLSFNLQNAQTVDILFF